MFRPLIILGTILLFAAGAVAADDHCGPPDHPVRRMDGRWRGRYSYPVAGKASVPFELFVRQHGDRIEGTIVEPRTFGDPDVTHLRATFVGTVDATGTFRFTKTYDGTGGVSHAVEYAGSFVRPQDAEGRWNIGPGWSGPFTLQRGEGGDATGADEF